MTVNPITEENLIVAKLDTDFAVPIHQGYADGALVSYVNGVLASYIAVDFGAPVATADGRGITGEATQPYEIRASVTYVAATQLAARTGRSSVVASLIGFTPNSNSGPLRAVGGGTYTIQDDSTKPTRYAAEAHFAFIDNLAPSYA